MGIDSEGERERLGWVNQARGPSDAARQARGPSAAARQPISFPLKSLSLSFSLRAQC